MQTPCPYDPAFKHPTYTSHFTKHNRRWTCVRVRMETGRKRKKNRARYMICPSAALSVHLPCWCVSAAVHSDERSITGNGLCEFLCLTLSRRNESVSVNTCVAGLPKWKLINTASALTPALCVCVCLQRAPLPRCTLFTNPPGHATCARSEAFVSSSF